jgi:hypothetical protein
MSKIIIFNLYFIQSLSDQDEEPAFGPSSPSFLLALPGLPSRLPYRSGISGLLLAPEENGWRRCLEWREFKVRADRTPAPGTQAMCL